MCTSTGTSGCGFETTTANCCAAALLDALMRALSRSTAQYSQPELLFSVFAFKQRFWHVPPRQATFAVTSHVLRTSFTVPSVPHAMTSLPLHDCSPGTHSAHRSSFPTQMRPLE